ncbi:MAG: hypothetical protein F4X44_09090 [Gammaproteobacteria bacterium]|nr:hypothetical protein [Gammaproteobacteria bacterium]MYD80754.1 hypothetical protein [Gammaproteobacteria bacterium]
MQTNSSPSRLVVLLSVAFLVGVGSACAVYWLFVALGNDEQHTDAVAPPSPAAIEPSTQVQSPPTEVSNAPEPPKFVVRSLDEIASMKSSSEQQLALRVLLSDMSAAQVADLLTQSQDIFEESDRYNLQYAMVQRLAHQNPGRALSFVLDMDTSYNVGGFVTSIFGDWAHSNLDEAVSRAGRLKPHFKRTALSAIVQERTDLSDNTILAIARDLDNEQIATSAIAQRKIEEAIDDPETAWNELAVDLQDDSANSRTVSRVATAWVEKSGLSVLDQIYHSLTNTQTRDDVIRSVLAEVAQTDPKGAFNYALTLEKDPYNSIISSVAGRWAKSDPRAALSAALEIERASVRKAVAESVVRTWAFDEPKAVLEGLDSLPDDLQESAARTALIAISRESPQEAADLVAAMESGSVKMSSASNVVSNWARHDHKAALEWILNEPGVEEIRSELLSSIMHTLARVDPELAMSTALAQPIDEDKSGFGMFSRGGMGMELSVISSLASSDVDKAIELLPQVRGGPTKLMSFQLVTQSLLMEDEIDKTFNMVQQVPESDRGKLYQAISTMWASTDPKGMLKSMDRFPSKEDRSRAAILLVTTNRYSKALSDEQVEEAKKHLTDEHAKAFEKGDFEALQSLFETF